MTEMNRSIKWLESQGWDVDIVERHMPHAYITKDLFHMWDLVAIRSDSPPNARRSSHNEGQCQRTSQKDQSEPTFEGLVSGRTAGRGPRLEREGEGWAAEGLDFARSVSKALTIGEQQSLSDRFL